MFVLQRILALLTLLGVAWLFRRLVGGGDRRGAAAAGGGRETPRVEGTMVRDRVCNTFLPRSRALTLRQGEEDHYFCSERCRQTFLGERSEVPG